LIFHYFFCALFFEYAVSGELWVAVVHVEEEFGWCVMSEALCVFDECFSFFQGELFFYDVLCDFFSFCGQLILVADGGAFCSLGVFFDDVFVVEVGHGCVDLDAERPVFITSERKETVLISLGVEEKEEFLQISPAPYFFKEVDDGDEDLGSFIDGVSPPFHSSNRISPGHGGVIRTL